MNVSIIIPTHNEEQYIQELLESIYKYIELSLEVIVVDNGSIDNTLEILKKFKCIVVKMDRKTFPSVARNAGALKATGDYLVFLDADVVITKQWALALEETTSNTNRVDDNFITGASYHVSQQPSWIEKYWFESLSKKKKTYINGGNIITTPKAYASINGFDESLETGEDVDFCVRARENGIKIILNDNWKVFHEGFPKTISAFLKRESWHGKGDLLDFNRFITSKIALATVVFICLHVILMMSSMFICSIVISSLSIFFIALLCYVRAVKDIAMSNLKQVFFTTSISYLYFLGRSFSFVRIFLK